MKRFVEAHAPMTASRAAVEALLADDLDFVLTGHTPGGDGRLEGLVAELSIEVGSGPGLSQHISIESGQPRHGDHATSVPLSWEASTMGGLFPSFEGELAVEDRAGGSCELVIRGRYDVPLGMIGGFGDVVAGRRVARRCISTYACTVAERLDHGSGPGRRHAVDIREQDPSELYIG